jgi:hypothetical protein
MENYAWTTTYIYDNIWLLTVGTTTFADRRRPLCRYSSLADWGHGVIIWLWLVFVSEPVYDFSVVKSETEEKFGDNNRGDYKICVHDIFPRAI